jgi:hypothetical protein
MNPLIEMYQHIAVALTAEPQLLLASAVAAFDPFWGEFEGDIDYETDPLHIALQVTRGTFPDIYASATERLRAGATYDEMDRLLCRAITEKGIPIDNLEMMSWGIPLVAAGVELEDAEFYTVHTSVLPALAPFGIDFAQSETYSIDVPECVYTVGRAIARDLHEHDDPALKQISWLFAWLFASSGNSLIDLTNEELYELQPLSWSPDDIAFAVEMIEEADGIMRDAMLSLERLTASPDLMAALRHNVTHLYRELKQTGKLDEHAPRLEWTRIDGGADRETVADAEFLQLRADAA